MIDQYIHKVHEGVGGAPLPEGGLSSSNAVLEVLPRVLDPNAGEQQHHGARALGRVDRAPAQRRVL
jgi:hypothetical protein